MTTLMPVTEPSTVDTLGDWHCAPRRAALTGTAPHGGCNACLTAAGRPRSTRNPPRIASLQPPDALLGKPPQLHALAMEPAAQPPALRQAGAGPILAHRPLQREAQDVRPVCLRRHARSRPTSAVMAPSQRRGGLSPVSLGTRSSIEYATASARRRLPPPPLAPATSRPNRAGGAGNHRSASQACPGLPLRPWSWGGCQCPSAAGPAGTGPAHRPRRWSPGNGRSAGPPRERCGDGRQDRPGAGHCARLSGAPPGGESTWSPAGPAAPRPPAGRSRPG
jgi:hypothetical protein